MSLMRHCMPDDVTRVLTARVSDVLTWVSQSAHDVMHVLTARVSDVRTAGEHQAVRG